MENTDIKRVVRDRYARAALDVRGGAKSSCCGTARSADPITSNLYDAAQVAELPGTALLASLGCGNPAALAELKAGETVLDLGSGGGIDVLLSAKRVGPSGKVYGLDITDEMLALAEENRRQAGIRNVEFLKGEIESIPLPDASVDVIISNCVINLSMDKDRVLREAFRILKPGGRFAVSDVVTRGEIPAQIRESILLWAGCVAGALDEEQYRAKLIAAGFQQVKIEPTRFYGAEDAKGFLRKAGMEEGDIEGKFMSAFISAVKPSTRATVPIIDLGEFKRLDLRVGKVTSADTIPGSRRLLKIEVDLGQEKRTLVAGLVGAYVPEQLVGRKVVVLANLAPAVIHGVRSEGMMLGVGCGGNEVALLTVDRDIGNGSRIA